MGSQRKTFQHVFVCVILTAVLALTAFAQAYAEDAESVGWDDAVVPAAEEAAPRASDPSADVADDSRSDVDVPDVFPDSDAFPQAEADSSTDVTFSPEPSEADPVQLGAPATQDLTGWYSPDGGETYYWYDRGAPYDGGMEGHGLGPRWRQ